MQSALRRTALQSQVRGCLTTGSRPIRRALIFNRHERIHRWQHVTSGRIVSRTKTEMRDEYGLKPDSLDSHVAGRI